MERARRVSSDVRNFSVDAVGEAGTREPNNSRHNIRIYKCILNRGKNNLKMMNKLAGSAFLCAVLAGCSGGTPQAVPTITQTVTQTATATVTAVATVTAIATVTADSAPAAVVAAAPATPATAVIPVNAAGMNADALDDELTALGFTKVIYNSDTGKTVLLLRNWTVTAVDNAGTEQQTDKAVVVHVTK